MAICKNDKYQCRFYLTAEQTGDQPSCTDDGDITNPEQDIYCGEIDGDDIVEWDKKKNEQNIIEC